MRPDYATSAHCKAGSSEGPKGRGSPPLRSKGPWTKEEDAILISLVRQMGPQDWRTIAKTGLPGRTSKGCRLRWHNHLDPSVNKQPMTAEEERAIVLAYAEYGSRWSAIARRLNHRTDNTVKNYWHSTLKKKHAPLLAEIQELRMRRAAKEQKQQAERGGEGLPSEEGGQQASAVLHNGNRVPYSDRQVCSNSSGRSVSDDETEMYPASSGLRPFDLAHLSAQSAQDGLAAQHRLERSASSPSDFARALEAMRGGDSMPLGRLNSDPGMVARLGFLDSARAARPHPPTLVYTLDSSHLRPDAPAMASDSEAHRNPYSDLQPSARGLGRLFSQGSGVAGQLAGVGADMQTVEMGAEQEPIATQLESGATELSPACSEMVSAEQWNEHDSDALLSLVLELSEQIESSSVPRNTGPALQAGGGFKSTEGSTPHGNEAVALGGNPLSAPLNPEEMAAELMVVEALLQAELGAHAGGEKEGQPRPASGDLLDSIMLEFGNGSAGNNLGDLGSMGSLPQASLRVPSILRLDSGSGLSSCGEETGLWSPNNGSALHGPASGLVHARQQPSTSSIHSAAFTPVGAYPRPSRLTFHGMARGTPQDPAAVLPSPSGLRSSSSASLGTTDRDQSSAAFCTPDGLTPTSRANRGSALLAFLAADFPRLKSVAQPILEDEVDDDGNMGRAVGQWHAVTPRGGQQ